jgi:YVTN family beta-propeller protein
MGLRTDFRRIIPIVGLLVLIAGVTRADERIGQREGGGVIVSTKQTIRPAGESLEYHGTPVDLVLSPDGSTVFAKDGSQILAIDAAKWTIKQQLKYQPRMGGSMHGIAVSKDGLRVYVTCGAFLCEAKIDESGEASWLRSIDMPGAGKRVETYPCGVAISPDQKTALVCLSIDNSLAIVDLEKGELSARIDVGVAPYGVAIGADGKRAYVSNWGGRRPKSGERTAKSAGTDTLIDEHGVACSGTISVIDLIERKQISEIEVGLHPADLKLNRDGSRLFVANANSDTVSVIDTSAMSVVETISVRPDPKLPFGSMSNALALSEDEKKLFVANGGNNAIVVVDLNSKPARVEGFIPTAWYPGAIAANGNQIFVANVKGIGTRDDSGKGKWSVRATRGSFSKIVIPTKSQLDEYTQRVHDDAMIPQSLRAWEKAQAGAKPTPVPARVGEPSVFEHIVYIIKENRTYDQVLGDIGKGNSDPKLCIYGKEVTPNHHALADQFVLLDNYYCNGVRSTDGHAWATEGLAVDFLEKAAGAWTRSYPFWGNDPLAFASTGFIWDNALLHGLSFRNYGEMSTSAISPPSKFIDVYNDWQNKTGKLKFEHTLGIEPMRAYTHPNYPGWNLRIPDQVRADIFLKEFEQNKQRGQFANLNIVYLPNDHTSGLTVGNPTPAAQVADNDLAVGRVVEAISHSPFWPKTCIFVIEDDPQDGFDHVDGHRSFCLVISPYTKRGAVVSNFYNQTSVLHTIELMLGLPPMNQLDAMAPAMKECFTDRADRSPYTGLKNNVPLDQINGAKQAMAPAMQEMAELSERQNLNVPDAADEDGLNRVLWYAARGEESYPREFAGAHGRGLKALHLRLDASVKEDDD